MKFPRKLKNLDEIIQRIRVKERARITERRRRVIDRMARIIDRGEQHQVQFAGVRLMNSSYWIKQYRRAVRKSSTDAIQNWIKVNRRLLRMIGFDTYVLVLIGVQKTELKRRGVSA